MKKFSPSFIGLGAAHAGLGVVANLLASHPDIANTVPVLNFFNTDTYHKKGLEWYEGMLLTESGKLIGECSPGYLTGQGVAKKIAHHYPDAKLFVIVRNPLKRAAAEYIHGRQTGVIPAHVSCAEYLSITPMAQIHGFYGQYLTDYFGYYSPLELKVLFYEDFVQAPLAFIQELYDFLAVNKNFIPKVLHQYAPMPAEPKHRSLVSKYTHRVVKEIKKATSRPTAPLLPPLINLTEYLNEDEIQVFTSAFLPDVEQLSQLVYRDMAVEWGLKVG